MSLMEQKVRQYKDQVHDLSGMLPQVAEAYDRFTGECFKAGELDERTKQLIALGVALFANNEACTYYHVQEAQAKGASDRQIMEAAAVASAAASGHALSQGAMRVQGALGIALGAVGDNGGIVNVIEPDRLSGSVRNDWQRDTEFSSEWESDGMSVPGGTAVSPSY